MNPVATSDAAFRGGACPTPEYTIAYTGNYTTSADANIGELEATLTDAALAMFGSLVGRAHLRARKRLEETLLASADQGRERLVRIADVLGAMAKAIRKGDDVEAAVTAVASLDLIEADALLIKRTTKPGRPDATGELAPEYKIFKQVGSRFLRSFTFEGRRATAPLRTAIGLLIELDGNWRKAVRTRTPGLTSGPHCVQLGPTPAG